ncbi:MAG: hypothetical protein GX663_06000 [Clostridiales bacterium]|nr:hypothetical protein [Clostridiales bacterium]
MKIKIRAGKIRFSLAVPIGMAGLAIRAIPESEFAKMRENMSKPYDQMITKEAALILFEECKEILKENKGLEAVHVEARDGTFVSIEL